MSKSIAQIKEEFGKADEKEREALYSMYDADARSGVQKLIASYRKKEEALRLERERLSLMKSYERKYKDAEMICGIDEAGRGPLAGPVVAGAVILPKDCEILYLNDSKKLSASRREALYDEIMEKAVAVGVGMASPARIDEINILQATYEAMRKAVEQLSVVPTESCCTGSSFKRCGYDSGDALSSSADRERRCKKCFHCGGKRYRESDKRQTDDAV